MIIERTSSSPVITAPLGECVEIVNFTSAPIRIDVKGRPQGWLQPGQALKITS
jgi:hypothetical protein